MAFIIDADWAIQVLGGRVEERRILQTLVHQKVAISVITMGEIYEGAFKTPNPTAYVDGFQRFRRAFTILDVTDAIMLRFGEIRAHLRRRGELIPDLDIVVGATAQYHDLTVLTNDL